MLNKRLKSPLERVVQRFRNNLPFIIIWRFVVDEHKSHEYIGQPRQYVVGRAHVVQTRNRFQ